MSLVTLGISIVLFYGFVVAATGLLPAAVDYPFPPEVAAAVLQMYSFLAVMDYLLPVALILTLFSFSILMEFAIWLWTLVRWLIGIVRGSKS